MEQCVQMQLIIYHSRNVELGKSLDHLAMLCANLKMYARAAELVERSVQTVSMAYGKESIAYGRELHKLSQLYFNDRNPERSRRTIQRSLAVLLPHIKDIEVKRMVLDLKKMRNVLKKMKN